MNKLNITFSTPIPLPVKTEPPKPDYSNPVGWWKATTEGDCEGKTLTDLGCHYGHAAEVALFLANKCFYSITLCARYMPMPSKRPHYETSVSKVCMTLDIDSGTRSMPTKTRTQWFEKWLDSDQIEVTDGSYYASVNVALKL